MVEIKINSEICKGCELCIDVCPKSVLALGNEMNAKGNHFVVDVVSALDKKLGKKQEFVEMNRRALDEGMDSVKKI